MKYLIIIFTLLSSLHAINGQNYYHYADINGKVNKRAILEIAKQELRRLLIVKKIPKSWEGISTTDVNKYHHSTSSNWIVIFKNKKIKNKKRQIIEIFINTDGNIIGSAYKK